MSNTLGNKLRVTVFGQSHAPAIGAVVEGLPAGMRPDMEAVSAFMARRAPGRDATATARREADAVEIIAGLNERGETCGAPVAGIIRNTDTRSRDYSNLYRLPCPGWRRPSAPKSSGTRATCAAAGSFPAASPRRCALPGPWRCNFCRKRAWPWRRTSPALPASTTTPLILSIPLFPSMRRTLSRCSMPKRGEMRAAILEAKRAGDRWRRGARHRHGYARRPR